MKRIWVAVCAMVLMVTLCVIELNFTNQSIDRLTDTLGQAEQSVSDADYETAFRLSQEAVEAWNTDHKALSFYTNHEQLEQVDQSLAAMTTYLELERYDEYIVESRRISAQLENVRDTESFALHNIF